MRKGTAFLLSLALCFGLTTTAMAAYPANSEEARAKFSLDSSVDEYDNWVETPVTLYTEDWFSEELTSSTVKGYNVIGSDTTLTITNTGAENDYYIWVQMDLYAKNSDGNYVRDEITGFSLRSGGFFPRWVGEDDPGCDMVELHTGESITFTGADLGSDDTFYSITIYQVYPELDKHWFFEYIFKVDNAMLAGIKAAGKKAETPVAYSSTQKIELDGKSVELQAYALKDENGNPTNYVKLRDLAYLLNGSKAQFEVSWDGAVNLLTGKAYTANGTEMNTPFSGDREYAVPTAATKINGTVVAVDAIYLVDDSGGGYTYYKLRDLGQLLDFNVGWSAEHGIFVETDQPYSDAD